MLPCVTLCPLITKNSEIQALKGLKNKLVVRMKKKLYFIVFWVKFHTNVVNF